LRNRIYDYALSGFKFYFWGARSKRHHVGVYRETDEGWAFNKAPYARSLTTTCHQLRLETKYLPFAFNEFYGCSKDVVSTLTHGSFDARIVQHLRLPLDVYFEDRQNGRLVGLEERYKDELRMIKEHPGVELKSIVLERHVYVASKIHVTQYVPRILEDLQRVFEHEISNKGL
jgi:hypothetical protein